MKLSKYLKISGDKGDGRKVDRGTRDLKKLSWDIKDGTVGENSKRLTRMGTSKIPSLLMFSWNVKRVGCGQEEIG